MSTNEDHINKVVVDWNQTQAEYPDKLFIHQLIEHQVERTPQAIAIRFQDEQLTYSELNARANQLSRHLIEQGVGPGSLVGVYMERCSEMIVALLAILKSGAGYLPLDPTYPDARVSYMVDDTKVTLVLTEQHLQEKVAKPEVEFICLDQLAELTAGYDTQNPAVSWQDPAQSLAYVIYTSGSTGNPKGIQTTHRNVVNCICAMAKTPGMNENDVLAAVTTISFDPHVIELYLTLSVGSTVVLVSDQVRGDGTKLAELLQQHKVTVMQATPSTWRLLMAANWPGDNRFKALYGAEAMPTDLLEKLLARTGSVWNLYGPTETTVWSSCKHIVDCAQRMNIGRPIANQRMYVLDDRLSPLPVGVAGELCIAGDGMSLGYLNKPELSAKVFIDNPFASQGGERLYRTGDIAQFAEDGDLVLLGRKDHQVKVRGFRIELGEIETTLRAFPAVEDAVVVSRKLDEDDNRLVAYITSPDHPEVSAQALREYVSAKLPQYMVPSFFIGLDEFPLTPSGKLDRNRLPDFEDEYTQCDEVQEESLSDIELRLIKIWGDILKIPQVDVSRTFLEQGGTSLLVMQLIVRTNKELGLKLSPAVLNDHSIRDLAGIYTQQTRNPTPRPRGLFGRLFRR